MKCRYNSKGSVLLYLIAAVTILTALGTGVFYMTTTSHFSGLGVGAQNKARALAESGIRYAFNKLRNRTLEDTTTPLEYKLNTPAADKFVLEVSGVGLGGNIKIESTGISNPGSPYQASHKITREITLMEYQQLTNPPFSFAGTGPGGITAMTTYTETSGVGKSGATGVLVDTINKQIILGMGQTQTYGCVWYQGWAHSNGSDCVEGRCNFNKGIRAYFDFEYKTSWGAHGFTFAIVSAHNNNEPEEVPDYINNYDDCGGGDCGEYMGYAGPGSKPSKHGLKPPKIAIEFDPYVSDDDHWICDSDSPFFPQCNSRRDIEFDDQHASLTYWGDDESHCGWFGWFSSNTYDDNRHGAGGAYNPKNPEAGDTNPDGTTHPYVLKDFDNEGTSVSIGSEPGRKWSFRLEIDRVDDPASADYRKYKLRAWLKPYDNIYPYDDIYKDSNGVTLNDTSKKYSQPPDFQQTITFHQDWHEKFDRMLFGFTQATGGEAQKVYIKNFQIDFKSRNDF